MVQPPPQDDLLGGLSLQDLLGGSSGPTTIRDPQSGQTYFWDDATGSWQPGPSFPRGPESGPLPSASPGTINNPTTGTVWAFNQFTNTYEDTGIPVPGGQGLGAAGQNQFIQDPATGEFYIVNPVTGQFEPTGNRLNPIGALDQARLGLDRQALGLQARDLQSQIQSRLADITQTDKQIALAEDRLALDRQMGNAAAVRDTQSILEQMRANRTQEAIALRGLQTRAAELQASIGAGNADRELTAQESGRGRSLSLAQARGADELSRLRERRGIATDLIEASARPGDPGAQATLLRAFQAGGGLGLDELGGAIRGGGANTITDESLGTSGRLIGLDDALRQRSEALFSGLANFGASVSPVERVSVDTGFVNQPLNVQSPSSIPGAVPGAAPPPVFGGGGAGAGPALTFGSTNTNRGLFSGGNELSRNMTLQTSGTDTARRQQVVSNWLARQDPTLQDRLGAAGLAPTFAHGGQLLQGIGIVGDEYGPGGRPVFDGDEEIVVDPTQDAQVISPKTQPALFQALLQGGRTFALGGALGSTAGFNYDQANIARSEQAAPAAAPPQQFASAGGAVVPFNGVGALGPQFQQFPQPGQSGSASPGPRPDAIGGVGANFNPAGNANALSLVDRARLFQAMRLSDALKAGGFTEIPDPVSVAAPGTAQTTRQQAAVAAQIGLGITAPVFNESLMRALATGVNSQAVRGGRAG